MLTRASDLSTSVRFPSAPLPSGPFPARAQGETQAPVSGPALTLSAAAATPTLKLGSSGAAVKELQTLLNRAGARIGVDGQFGHGTDAAVIQYQISRGLSVDGVVGPATWKALRSNKAAIAPLNERKMPAQYRQWIKFVNEAARKYSLPPALIFGVMSRETNGRNIIGDGGHGHGLMQIDDRSWGAWLRSHHNGMDPRENILKGAEILRSNLNYFHGDVRAAVAAYNAGAGNVSRHRDNPDVVTTGGNYSRDVLSRTSMFH